MEGKRQKLKVGWPTTQGLVYSVDWIEPSRNNFGHYEVVYSYRVGDERYTGSFSDYGRENEDYLHPNDEIDVQYDPNRPDLSHYPLVRTATYARLLLFGIGAGVAIIVMTIVYLSGGFN